MTEYVDKGRVNYWTSGQAAGRAVRAMLAGEIDHVMWRVFIVMAGFIKDDSVCWASYNRIAKRCGLSRASVAAAVKRLEELGWLVKLGKATVTTEGNYQTRTVRYRVILKDAQEADHSPPPGHKDTSKTTVHLLDTRTVHPVDTRDSPPPGHKSESSLSERQASERDDDREPADAGASADAAAPAAAPSMSPSPKSIVSEIMAAKGCTQSLAEVYYKRKIAEASGPVRNDTKYIRTCLENEAAGAASSAKKTSASGAKGSAKTKKPAPTARAKPRRGHNQIKGDERSDVVRRDRAGEDRVTMAAELWITESAIETIRREADNSDARSAFRAGDDYGSVLERFGDCAADNAARWTAVDAVWRGESLERFGEDAAKWAPGHVEKSKEGASRVLASGKLTPEEFRDRCGEHAARWALERQREQREQEAERQREQVELNRRRAQEKVEQQREQEARKRALASVVPLPQPAVNGSARPWAFCQHAGCGVPVANGRTYCEQHRRPW